MTDGSKDTDDRVFVRDGFRHYRRRYSLLEVRIGLGIGACLLLLAIWIGWKGRHPPADLMGDPALLLKTGTPATTTTTAPPPSAGPATTKAERGALPADLAGPGFREDKLASFTPDNLYVKIDGRADYFRAFGFRGMNSVLLVSASNSATTIDVELYDHGTAANALGAYGGERPPTVKPEVTAASLHHIDRNALYMARGPYYIRAIGSDETPQMVEALRALADKFIASIKSDPLPWAYAVFVRGLGLDPGSIVYFSENAFSLSFAKDVWTARPGGKDSDLELFVAVQPDAAAARVFAEKLHKSFLEMGAPAGKAEGAALVKDQFLSLMSGAVAKDRFVAGVRGAADAAAAGAELKRLRAALTHAPASAAPAQPQGGASNEH